uniref:Peptidase M23 n=1 Tax=Aeromonas sp. Ne-1 TaxID=1675689 RepID=A0A0H4J986_9GAMM|nr:M23 family metallopeptidase [Aeromonas sp. Ne-1]AKO69700.1 peptidase M23 [Aeromonas sp. Ne-1]
MLDKGKQALGSLLFFLKNPYVLGIVAIVFIITVTVINVVVIMGGTLQSESSDEDVENLYTVCTNGELNKEKFYAMFESAGAFTKKGDEFIAVSKKVSIDPVLLASIAFNETGSGTSKMVKERNNPGGLYDSVNKTFFTYPSLSDGLYSMAKNLFKNYISIGLVSIEQIGSKYAPLGVANDPNNLNANWVPNVSSFANKFGGLTMNCESANLGSGNFVNPVPNPTITSSYGYRIDPITGAQSEYHKGTDFACKNGDPIYASASGTVHTAIYEGWGGGYGHYVMLQHGDKYTLYGHMRTPVVKIGDKVKQGQKIGECGTTGSSTGYHLHFEIQLSPMGERVDPMKFLNKK